MTIDMYIWELEEPTRGIMDYIHHLVLHLSPTVDASIKWKIPFYTLDQPIMYMNPLKSKTGGVELCFPRGRHFDSGQELLDFKDRKVVGGYTLHKLEEIDEAAVTLLINETIRLDGTKKGTTPWKE